jgi:uncharacterized protein
MMAAVSEPGGEWLGEFDNAKLTPRYFATMALLVFQEMFEFYDFFLVGYLVSALAPSWHLTYGTSAIMLLSSGLGSMGGALLFGRWADHFGRRSLLVLGGLLFSAGCGGCSLLADDAWIEFSVLRFLVGFGFAGVITVQTALMVEITPTRHRTFLSSLMFAPAALGTFFAALLTAHLMPVIGWRGLAATGALPISVTLGIWLWAPESVRWLMTRNRMEDARREAARLLGVGLETVSMPANLTKPPDPISISELLQDRGRCLWVITLWLGTSISAYGVQLWGPTIVSQFLRIPPSEAAAYFVGLSVASFLGRIVFSFLPVRVGRRRSAEIMCYGSALILLLAGLLNQQFVAGWSVFALLIVVGAAVYSGGFANIAPYTVEAFPVKLGARAYGLGQAFNGLGKIIGPLFLAFIAGTGDVISPEGTIGAVPTAFIFLAVCSAIAGVACTLFRVETHGRPLSLFAGPEKTHRTCLPLRATAERSLSQPHYHQSDLEVATVDKTISNTAAAAVGTPAEATYADGMHILWDVPIPMDDGISLRADIFLPDVPGRYAAILSYGPYGKGLSFQSGYKSAWDRMVAAYPQIAQDSSNKYQNWEVVDPEKWVPDGYACVRVDSRGAGRSPGRLEPWSIREARDLHDCIEWTAAQDWSNGKVGLNGISYYAMNQWHVAALQPPHLAAICVWEGAADHYRDVARHGGIYSHFLASWYSRQIVPLQHGYGERGPRSTITGELVSGPDTLTDAELAANRSDPADEALRRPLDEAYYRDRSADFSRIVTPLLCAGNWGGMGLHPRGNFEGFLAAASPQKWLEVHGDTHFAPFYRGEGVVLQKRFFDHFLQDKDTGWDRQPPVQLQIRRPGEHFTLRNEREWPLARTKWMRFYLDPGTLSLGTEPVVGDCLSYDTNGDGITFSLPPSTEEMEITGPVAARLVVSSDTDDADLFLALRLFAPDGKEVLFIGSNDPQVPIALGWLRASHRKLDPGRSLPHRPYHTHDEVQLLTPYEPVALDIEIWPTCIVVPPSYTLVLNVRGCDYDHGLGDIGLADAPYKMTGVGPFLHSDPKDRPVEVFGGRNTLHFDKGREPFLLLPVIPGGRSDGAQP